MTSQVLIAVVLIMACFLVYQLGTRAGATDRADR
jgi:hypothetical protein